MAVYVGVNGERKQVATPVAGVNGEVRHIVGAYAGVDGEVRRIPAMCLIDHIEIQPVSVSVYGYANTTSANHLIGTGLSALTAVGGVAAYDSGIDITLSTANRSVLYTYMPTVILKDGCEIDLYKFCYRALPDISFPVVEAVGHTSSASGYGFTAVFLGHELSLANVITSAASNSNYIFVWLPSSASGYVTVSLNFSAATIDGNSVDVYVIEPTASNVG